jgi:hypothetical protein
MTAALNSSDQLALPAAVTSCVGCGEPIPPRTPTERAADFRTMSIKAEEGCLTCSLLKEGVDRCVAENEKLKSETGGGIKIYTTGRKSVLIRVNNTFISFFVMEGKYLSLW